IALLSYRNYKTYQATQDDDRGEINDYKASSYQNYQGEKLVNRFNAFSYWTLSKTMDSHDVSRGRGSLQETLSQVKAKTLVVGVDSDILFPVSESVFIADHVKGAELEIIKSLYGHDGFLIETEQLKEVFEKFYLTQKLKTKQYEYA
ncbi:MAG: homoserine O-acetyltransferase, partial [Flavobacteriales bacterium]|nr:homoserine O-acetyltransferase [Flavobacteriales bacterium]